MKLCYFNYMADLYGYSIGSTVKAQRLLGHLRDLGHQVEFHWLSPQRQQAEHSGKTCNRRTPVRNAFFTPKQLLRNVLQFFRENALLKRNPPDALLVRLDAFRISALWAAKARRLPMLIEADGASSYEWLTFNRRGLWPTALLWCEKKMLKDAVGIFTQSQAAKDYFVRTHGLSPERITVITNGADPVAPISEHERRELAAKLGLSAARQIVGFVGSMHHWHGVQQMSALVGTVLGECPDAAFLFVGGGGALEAELKNRLQDARQGRVAFSGTVPYEQVHRYVQLFTVAVAPYPPIKLFYFSPVKVFEYMAAGKPMTAARIGQLAEILRHEENALLYEPGDVDQLQQQIIRLLKDEVLRRRLGENAQKAFYAEHTWRHKAEQLDRYLRACLGRV